MQTEDEIELKKLRWRCRRGLLENDLFIERFFQRFESSLTVRQAGGLEVLMDLADNDLLDLLRGLVVELNLAVVIVTHDLGVARLLADRLLVMKQGQVVESGLTDRVLDDPHHPYTQLLVSSVLQN